MSERNQHPSRRTIAKGAAWTSPALLMVAASPAFAVSPKPDLTTTITPATSTTHTNGAVSGVTYTMTNSGTAATNGQTLIYTIQKPTTGTLTLGTLPAGWSLSSENGTSYTLVYTGTLAAGASAPAIPATYVAGPTAGTVSLTAAVAPGAGGEVVTSNNAASASVTVTASAACKSTTMTWAASTTKTTNPYDFQVTGTTYPLYARVTYTETAAQDTNTTKYQLTRGKNAWGQVSADFFGNLSYNQYAINTTGGGNDLILSQKAGTGATTVTVSFYQDAARTIPAYVNNLVVPLDDFSTQRTYPGGTYDPTWSYQELWSVSGATATGAVTPTKTALQNPYNATSTLANVSGSGTLADPWNFPVALTNSSRNQVGGNLITSFSSPVTSVTVTYGSNSTMTGRQSAGLGQFTLCY